MNVRFVYAHMYMFLFSCVGLVPNISFQDYVGMSYDEAEQMPDLAPILKTSPWKWGPPAEKIQLDVDHLAELAQNVDEFNG